ncbi:sugar-binding transcriptional regulator [Lactococcus chungangensis]|jgi:Transcriptional regulator, contains sigma factor-related N-terminal domain|uniref:sugar-binding transcriptional regulator n=1 Tax=Pseudolactococcus chungangensis TaxID=451457 RepID=UPI0028D7D606|nr:sugar-binding domain-containing protein [Lactococcus chungangensis]
MTSENDDKLLVRVAEMYYLEEKTQSQISKELGIHRTTISRLLKQARTDHIVQITINYDLAGTYSIEKEFKERFKLKNAIIIPVAKDASKHQKLSHVAEAASVYFKTILTDNQIIGFSWGTALAEFVNHLDTIQSSHVRCLPLIGGSNGRLVSDYHVNTIVYEAAKKINAEALLIDSPAIVPSKKMHDELMRTEYNKRLADLWNKTDIAIFGIGSSQIADKDRWQNFYGEYAAIIADNKGIGDIVSHFIDENGQQVCSEFNERIIGIDLEKLHKIPERLAIVEGKEKAQAILSTLKGGYLTTLVTTEETAQEILNFID